MRLVQGLWETSVQPENIPDEWIERVEDECGMGSAAWDCIDPKEIIAASINVYEQSQKENQSCDHEP